MTPDPTLRADLIAFLADGAHNGKRVRLRTKDYRPMCGYFFPWAGLGPWSPDADPPFASVGVPNALTATRALAVSIPAAGAHFLFPSAARAAPPGPFHTAPSANRNESRRRSIFHSFGRKNANACASTFRRLRLAAATAESRSRSCVRGSDRSPSKSVCTA